MHTTQTKSGEVQFLSSEFDISPLKAAALVAEDEEEVLRLAAEERERELAEDPLGDYPVPVSPEEHQIPDDGGLQKTVLRRRNDRGRAGP
jgi:hypothetical protein